MATEKVALNHSKLIDLAQDETISLQSWANFMQSSKQDRQFFNERFERFQDHRSTVELCVKGAVSLTLGVGLFLASPVTLIGGAALTLSLSTGIFSQIDLHKHEVELDKEFEFELPEGGQFNEAEWSKYRHNWCVEARNHALSAQQTNLQTNMNRIGLGLVMGFACFTAISSGAAIPLTIATVLYSASLFYTRLDEPKPFMENEKKELPALSIAVQ